jgi:ankyrin repeat protein
MLIDPNYLCRRFRWAQCQLDTLESCSSSEEISQALESLPEGLPATYERILVRVDKRQRENVRLVLVSLAFAERSLSIDEVVNILRIDPGRKPPTKNITIYPNRLLAACSSLVSTFSSAEAHEPRDPPPKLHLRLAHLSVKEYLMSEELKRSPVSEFWTSHGVGNRIMAERCIGSLLQHDDVASFGPQTLEAFPLTIYAARCWGRHAREANGEEIGRELLNNLLLDFLQGSKPEAFANWRRTQGLSFVLTNLATKVTLGSPWNSPAPAAALHHEIRMAFRAHAAAYSNLRDAAFREAAGCNLWRTVRAIFDRAQPNKDAMDLAMDRALCSSGFESLAALISLGDVDINQRHWRQKMTLLERCPTAEGIRWLVARGASMQPDSDLFWHPLFGACRNPLFHNSTAKLKCLLELGADPDIAFEFPHARTVWLSTPLQVAAYEGYSAGLELLLDHGATLNLIQGRVGSSLHAAALSPRPETFSYLLSRGADIHAVSEQFGTILWAAGYGGSEKIVESCLEHGLCWDEFIDAKLEGVRGCTWASLDCETQNFLITRIIRVSKERHCSLGEAVKFKMVTFEEAIRLARNFGVGDGVLDEVLRGQRRDSKDYGALWDYPFQGPLSSDWRYCPGSSSGQKTT